MSLNIVFAGTPQFAVPTLQALIDSDHRLLAVYTQPDRPAGRGRQLLASPVKQLAMQYDLTVQQPITLRDKSAQSVLQSYQPDVMVVVAYGLLLPKAVLSIPLWGCVNIHPSLLPRWRGAAPIQHTLLAGDTETGVCIMQMDEGMDTGNIVYCQKEIILPQDNSQTLHDRLSHLGAKCLLSTLDQLEQSQLTISQQDDDNATYATKIQKSDAQIDWSWSVIDIANRIRAFNPWPIAYTQLQGQTLRLWQASILSQSTDHIVPGTVVGLSTAGLDVATGTGILRCLQVQLPGARRIASRDFYNAHHDDIDVGVTRLG